MFIATTALVAFTLVQQPVAETPKPELAVISARLGRCSADFTVKDLDGKPVYAAIIHVRIRYGFLGVKRMDLEIGTNSDGKARIDGLPDKARLLTYDISSAGRKAAVEQDLSITCEAAYDVPLKN